MNSLLHRLVALLVPILALQASSFSHADTRADPASIERAVAGYLQMQIKGLPGESTFTIGAISASSRSEQCDRMDVGMAPGARPWGRTHVNVRCASGNGIKWSLFVPVHIQVMSQYLVSARPVTAGQTVTEADLQYVRGDLSDLPAGVLTDAVQAIGQVMTLTLPPGRPFRADTMRQAMLVKQGQSVKILTAGAGFQATNEGRALNNASLGQVAQVRMASGQVISGLVRNDGMVDIKF